MNKIKKISASFSLLLLTIFTKAFADDFSSVNIMVESKYGIFNPEPTAGEKILSIGQIIVPIVLFLIGIFAIISKKMSKRTKIISILSLILFYILFRIMLFLFQFI